LVALVLLVPAAGCQTVLGLDGPTVIVEAGAADVAVTDSGAKLDAADATSSGDSTVLDTSSGDTEAHDDAPGPSYLSPSAACANQPPASLVLFQFCQDFDSIEDASAGDWSGVVIRDGGMAVVTDAEAKSPPQSLGVLAPNVGGGVFELQWTGQLNPQGWVQLAFDVYVDSEPGAAIPQIGLAQILLTGEGPQFKLSYLLETGGADVQYAVGPLLATTMPPQARRWNRVNIVQDVEAGTAVYMNDQPVFQDPTTASQPLVGPFAQVGLIYVQAEDGGSPVTVYIDNVVFSGGN
jgi:hypothetical protein